MKSIMQEASTITKAIEQAWINAGKPKEFSIKIFEEPQRNFLGLTTKSAKIGIFFQEHKEPHYVKSKSEARYERSEPRKEYTPHAAYKKPYEKREPYHKPEEPRRYEQHEQKTIWSDEMVGAAKQWVVDVLACLEKADVSFTTNINNYYLRFSFNQPLATTDEKERQLFRSFSFLMLQSLKRQFRRPLRGFKIVLTRAV